MCNRHARLMFSRFPCPLSLFASPLCSVSSSGDDVDVQDIPFGLFKCKAACSVDCMSRGIHTMECLPWAHQSLTDRYEASSVTRV
jgi:hypothetical protein